jgi:hypothetical protein
VCVLNEDSEVCANIFRPTPFSVNAVLLSVAQPRLSVDCSNWEVPVRDLKLNLCFSAFCHSKIKT